MSDPNLDNSKATPEGRCATCGATFDRVTIGDCLGPLFDEPTPEPEEGDFTLCIWCATPHRLNADLTLRKATAAELDALDADTAGEIRKAHEAIRGAMYERCAELTHEMVGRFKADAPAFVMPPKEIAIIGPLTGIGPRLACNTAAVHLLAAVVSACKRRGWDDPTVMMLRVALDMHEIHYEVVSLSDLGLEVGTS